MLPVHYVVEALSIKMILVYLNDYGTILAGHIVMKINNMLLLNNNICCHKSI